MSVDPAVLRLINDLRAAHDAVDTAELRLRERRAARDRLIMRLHDKHGWGARRIAKALQDTNGGLTSYGVRNIIDRERARREGGTR